MTPEVVPEDSLEMAVERLYQGEGCRDAVWALGLWAQG